MLLLPDIWFDSDIGSVSVAARTVAVAARTVIQAGKVVGDAPDSMYVWNYALNKGASAVKRHKEWTDPRKVQPDFASPGDIDQIEGHLRGAA